MDKDYKKELIELVEKAEVNKGYHDYFKNKDSYNYSYEMTELNPNTFTIEGLKRRMTAIDFRDWFWAGFNNVGPNNSLDTKINNTEPDSLLDLPI